MLQQLEQMGIQPSAVHCNLSQSEWKEQELERNEGRLSDNGTVIVNTGIYTGRSPKDRFIVKNKSIENLVDWGEINQPLSEEAFDDLEENAKMTTRDELEVMTVKNLKVLARNCGVKSRGNKNDLVDRIYQKISASTN